MLKKAAVLTRPAPARQDAPFRRQGRSERRGEEVRTALRVCRSPIQMDPGERISPSSVSDLRKTLFNVEPLSDTRTPLADFFSILLVHEHSYVRLHMRGSQDVERGRERRHLVECGS